MDDNDECVPCPLGKYCPGGNAAANPDNLPLDCPEGLLTTFTGAKSQGQCFTTPGYGRVSARGSDGRVSLTAMLCPVGTYNVGSNTAACHNCGPGLTTATNGSTSLAACQAPAGSRKDKSIGKLCKQGTFSTDLNTNSTCEACPVGVTTAAEGSTSADACVLAQKGYHINPDNPWEALECPHDTYQDQESSTTSCIPCPNGYKTQDTAATGVSLCLAPPGYELLPEADAITACPVGSYKEDWNRNACIQCGTGVITAAEGSDSKDACLVPAGWGLTSLYPMVAEPCQKNAYGDVNDRVVAVDARCTACPPDMFTMDVLEGRPRNGNELFTSEAACLVKPGWGATSTVPQECPAGTFNKGKNRLPCQHCDTGFTTVAAGRSSAAQCVIQAGWQVAADGIPAPCDQGTYSIGGSEAEPNATCTACMQGWSTQLDGASSAEECAVCAPGYGGASCAQCSHGTFAAGGAVVACSACAAGSTSRRGASQSQQCYSTLIGARNDVFNLADESAWAEDAATTGDACSVACTASASCVMYRFTLNKAGDGSGKCSLLSEATTPTHTAGFKIDSGDDYSVWGLTQSAGLPLSQQPSGIASEAGCMAACSDAAECEVYVWQSGSNACSLTKSELEEDTSSMFQVRGGHLYFDLHP
ncbi:hypothetical protein COO60DRAFT_1634747 [Scenedesmus sp. NREL 46B-D3]|nr:hypothetical protein COO60DRAFT_1634747 [Scenedesmus sp. NREL 46B-D3]